LKKFSAAIFRDNEKFMFRLPGICRISCAVFVANTDDKDCVSFGPKGNKPKAIGPKANIQAYRLFDRKLIIFSTTLSL